jgi:hypothetical protein
MHLARCFKVCGGNEFIAVNFAVIAIRTSDVSALYQKLSFMSNISLTGYGISRDSYLT